MASILLCVVSVALWGVALFRPAFTDRDTGVTVYSGLQCLLLGWWGLFGIFRWALPWLANVFYWVSMIGSRVRHPAGRYFLVVSLITIPLALVTYANRTIAVDEAGHTVEVAIGPAFYFWLASMLVLVAANIFTSLQRS